MKMKIAIHVYKDEDGIFIAESPNLPGFHTYGKTQSDLEKNIQEALQVYTSYLEDAKSKTYTYDFVSLSFLDISLPNYVRAHH